MIRRNVVRSRGLDTSGRPSFECSAHGLVPSPGWKMDLCSHRCASRMILAAGEFDHATAENAIKLLDEAYHRYAHIAPIIELITDQR